MAEKRKGKGADRNAHVGAQFPKEAEPSLFKSLIRSLLDPKVKKSTEGSPPITPNEAMQGYRKL